MFSVLYGLPGARLEREGVNRGLKRTGVRAGERVLEVAVGTGLVHARLRSRLGSTGLLVGVDLSPGMLRVTRRQVPEARLARADARQLPFPAETFDVLYAGYFLDLIPTRELVPLLGEFRRVLRRGGRLALVNFSKNGEPLTWWERAYQVTPTFLVPWLFAGCRPVQAEPSVRAAGFAEVKREFIPGGLDSEIITARK